MLDYKIASSLINASKRVSNENAVTAAAFYQNCCNITQYTRPKIYQGNEEDDQENEKLKGSITNNVLSDILKSYQKRDYHTF